MRYRSGARTWGVFGADGARRATARLPASFRPCDIGGRLAVGRWEGELDVEYVRVYRLGR